MKKNIKIILTTLLIIVVFLGIIFAVTRIKTKETALDDVIATDMSEKGSTSATHTKEPETTTEIVESITKETTTEEKTTDSYEAQEKERDDYYSKLVADAVSKGQKIVYLTFDDGSSTLTPTVLDTLDSYGVKATFFVVAAYCSEDYASTMYNEIINRGNTLGMHSYTHSRANIYASDEAFIEDFDQMYEYVNRLTGHYSWLWRFPGGSSTSMAGDSMKNVYIPYITNKGVTYFDWNVSCGDGDGNVTSDSVYKKVIDGVAAKDVSVVLMHDGNGHDATVAALPDILNTLINEMGCLVVPITQSTTPVQHNIG